MKIFSSAQLKDWDTFSIHDQQITSDTLMERAAIACYNWLIKNQFTNKSFSIFCGKGNNAGDGLALARILLQDQIPVTVYILETGKPGSPDFQLNLQRLHLISHDIHYIQSDKQFPEFKKNTVIIDALFGTGLNKPLNGITASVVGFLNNSHTPIISIDVPSGLYCDKSSKDLTVIQAIHTLSFQSVKLAFLFPENDKFVGEFHILDIGLSAQFYDTETALFELVNTSMIRYLIKPRNKFSHKGDFGHAVLIAGSYGMMGAAILAAKGCLQCGTGKLTCYIPASGFEIMQTAVPEAMCKISTIESFSKKEISRDHPVLGIGPGIGTEKETIFLLKNILESTGKQLILDADALNIISKDGILANKIPTGSVITPHLKEFERLFGASENDFERLEQAIENAARLHIYIVLKGHFTAIITPHGKVYFNSSGNAGMAKAGMGDVLTGMVTGLLSMNYSLPEAALIAVFIHGTAGDIAAEKFTQHAMQASDLINNIKEAWKILEQ